MSLTSRRRMSTSAMIAEGSNGFDPSPSSTTSCQTLSTSRRRIQRLVERSPAVEVEVVEVAQLLATTPRRELFGERLLERRNWDRCGNKLVALVHGKVNWL